MPAGTELSRMPSRPVERIGQKTDPPDVLLLSELRGSLGGHQPEHQNGTTGKLNKIVATP